MKSLNLKKSDGLMWSGTRQNEYPANTAMKFSFHKIRKILN